MGFRFYRRVRLFPGVSVNLSRSGPSLSVGIRGAHVTVGRRGVTKTVGIPGSGMFYTSRHGYHTGYHSTADHAKQMSAAIGPQQSGPAKPGVGCLIVVLVMIALGLLASL